MKVQLARCFCGFAQDRQAGRRRRANDCERGDSNPHAFRHQILSLARLPIPPLSQTFTVNRLRLLQVAYKSSGLHPVYIAGIHNDAATAFRPTSGTYKPWTAPVNRFAMLT
jgi:hypothetical protein